MKTTIPLQVIDLNDDGFHLLVEAFVFNTRFNIVLDTGASKTVFDQSMLLEVQNSLNITASERLSAGLGTTTMASYSAILNNFKIGKLSLLNFEVAVLDLSTINQAYQQLNHPQVLGVLGGDILMQYKAVINYNKLTLRLEI
ncbi:clan AA aspartic protease [Mucilaginibacter robiniae]|uniref:Clan AA aspartic protease n=1 Tax=Mucilaginibacter robiniae TaxID=2728022 RepID=A0A7L5E6Q0_9SPHI|nr:aspartyl protease family protein [Mucilaginibacter robiniae]QJD98057.1 clan AA aspartic protease [Mucilaginibacter robiniae]